jgi:hypothetical protein
MEEEYNLPPIQEDIIFPESSLKDVTTSKYAILTNSEYITLNHALSTAKGYDLVNDTARCFPIVPKLAKVDIVDETFKLACVALVDAEAQEKFPELLTGIELVESYTPAETTVEELVAEGLTQAQIDWEIDHLRFFHDGLKVVWLESESPSPQMEPILEELGNELTLVVVDNEK